jgi:hypothetical protein
LKRWRPESERNLTEELLGPEDRDLIRAAMRGMGRPEVEYASASRGLNAYESLAKWAGVPLEVVVERAQEGRLGELVETRSHMRPLSGAEALRHIESVRREPGSPPKSPHAALGELRAMRACWGAVEAEEARRHRDPDWRLGEILAKRIPPGDQ